MESSKNIFLSKSGKTFGPFSQSEIDSLRNNGELNKFSWICFDPKKGWEAILPPPPPPASEQALPIEAVNDLTKTNVTVAKITASPPAFTAKEITRTKDVTRNRDLHKNESIVALCHNRKILLSGVLADINAEGCTLTEAMPKAHSMPWFRSGTRIHLNLLDSNGARSENVRATIVGAIKRNQSWDYRLRWEIFPQILK